MKILIIQTAFIGDVVLATGMLEQLHQWYPQASISFLLRKGNEGLLKDHPYLDEVLIWDKKNGKYNDLYRLLKQIRSKKYDAVINVQRFAATGILTAFSGAKVKIGFDKNPLSALFTHKVKHRIQSGGRTLHEIQRNVELILPLQPAGIEAVIPVRPRLYPSIEDTKKILKYQIGEYITISPASIWFTKMFPVKKWVDFIELLPFKYTIYILGAPSDKALADEIIQLSARPQMVNLCGELSFLQSAELMKTATMNYVNDSAPMHFASSVNAPVTAVYCSTLPSFGFGPLSDNSTVVETKVALNCRPCGLHGHKACPEKHFKCAHSIEVTDLLETIV